MSTFMNYIGDNYNDVKFNLNKLCNCFNDILFDEDIFHDTIMKADSTLGQKNLTPNEYERYMYKSFRTNLVRDKLYYRSSMPHHSFDLGLEYKMPFTEDYVEHTIDFNSAIKILDKKFGMRMTKAYIDWLSGYSIKDVMIKHEIDSGYYHIKKMTEYIRGYYENEMMLY